MKENLENLLADLEKASQDIKLGLEDKYHELTSNEWSYLNCMWHHMKALERLVRESKESTYEDIFLTIGDMDYIAKDYFEKYD